MAACHECGSELEEDFTYCPDCGAKIEEGELYSKPWYVAPIVFGPIGGMFACHSNHNHNDKFKTRECKYRQLAWGIIGAWVLIGFMFAILA